MSGPKNLYIEILDRDFNDLSSPPNLEFTINRYSKTINGGCKEAHITAYGSDNALWELANMLRYGLYIYDVKGTPVWWGYIAEVKIRVGNLVFGVTLDTMYNKVKVVYTSFGVRSNTDWEEDTYSSGVYGEKQLLSVVSDATQAEAEQRCLSDLNAKKLPIPTVEFEAQSEGSFSAALVARGFYDTLGWKYYNQNKGLVEHSINGVGQQRMGAYLSACMVFDSENKRIKHWGEDLTSFRKGEIITVSGTSNNNGTYTVSQGSTSGSSISVEENLTDETAANAIVTAGCYLAQQFRQQSGASWDASSIYVRAQPSGSPQDNLCVALYSFNSSSPDSLLASGCRSGSDMAESMVWHEIPLSSSVTLANNTYYYVMTWRSSGSTSLSSSHHYKLDMDEGLGYENGDFLISTSEGWLGRSTDADMLFKVAGTQPVTDQIAETCASAGQFLEGTMSEVSVDDVPETNQYRDGESTALTEINDLLKVGTSNNLRILAEITPNRKLYLSEQISKDADAMTYHYKATPEGVIETFNGEKLANYTCPVGIWIEIDSFLPSTFDRTYLANPSKTFIEECEYYVQSDKIVPRSIDTSNVWELGKVKEG